MKVYYSVNNRKRLVQAMADFIGVEGRYLGTPSYAYEVNGIIVDRAGTLNIPEDMGENFVKQLIEALKEKDFHPVNIELHSIGNLSDGIKNDSLEEKVKYIISMPSEKVNIENLANLIKAKGATILKALDIKELPVKIMESEIQFPWFDDDIDPEKINTYIKFISLLCQMSIKQKYVSAKEKVVTNEKYAFRCFLLRLGFIGDEYKNDRKILLENLTGNSAFKTKGRNDRDEFSK